MNIELELEDQSGALVVRPRFARLDALVGPAFRARVLEKAKHYRAVVIDLEHVKGIDSSGIGCIISVLKQIPAGGTLRLARANREVRTLLELTRLDRVLKNYDDVQSALSA